MSTKYVITPYSRRKANEMAKKGELFSGDLRIEPEEYARELLKHWSKAHIEVPQADIYLLHWELPTNRRNYAGLEGWLSKNAQAIYFDTGPREDFLEFVLWHRRIIPAKYHLFLHNSSETSNLELKPDTSAADIIAFTAIEED